jgi:glutathione S-transferase
MYERVGFERRRPSPFSWRTRYALTHKGLDVEYRPTGFADVETIKRLSGQHLVPIIVDRTTVVHDSWRIATYLEDKFPDRPALFGGDAARPAHA